MVCADDAKYGEKSELSEAAVSLLLGLVMGKGSDGAAVPPGSGMSPKEESKQIQQAKLKASEMRAGDKYFVVASAWYSSWAAYTNDPDENGEKPAAIDNTVILIPKSDVIKPTNDKPVEGFEPQVKAGLAETTDYVLVAEAEWNLLVSWYVQNISYPSHCPSSSSLISTPRSWELKAKSTHASEAPQCL